MCVFMRESPEKLNSTLLKNRDKKYTKISLSMKRTRITTESTRVVVCVVVRFMFL